MTIVKRDTKKSVKLRPEEMEALKDFVGQHETRQIAAKALSIPLSTLDRIQLASSGAPKNVKKIRRKIVLPEIAA